MTGWLLQITIGEIDWSLFACPVNIIVLVLYIAGIVAMHCLRKRVYFFGWMSHYTSAVSSLVLEAGNTVGMGLIRQIHFCHPADMLVKMPEDMDWTDAAMAEPLTISLHGIHRGGLKAGEYCAIIGAGPIGLLAGLIAQA